MQQPEITKYRRVKTGTEKNIENDDCREMTEGRLLEILSNDTLQKVKSAAKTCKVSTAGSKMDIIMKIKQQHWKTVKNFAKFFQKYGVIQEDSFCFFCPHRVVYYLKFLLQSESSCNYIDSLWNIYLISQSLIWLIL